MGHRDTQVRRELGWAIHLDECVFLLRRSAPHLDLARRPGIRNFLNCCEYFAVFGPDGFASSAYLASSNASADPSSFVRRCLRAIQASIAQFRKVLGGANHCQAHCFDRVFCFRTDTRIVHYKYQLQYQPSPGALPSIGGGISAAFECRCDRCSQNQNN